VRYAQAVPIGQTGRLAHVSPWEIQQAPARKGFFTHRQAAMK